MAEEETPTPTDEQDEAPVTAADDNDAFYDVEQSAGLNPASEVSWQASEYIHHEKSSSWYFGLIGSAILVGVLLFLLTDDVWSFGGITSYVVLIIMTAAVFVYAKRQPDTLQYKLDDTTLTIGARQFLLEDFRSFSVVQDGAVDSIVLSPLKRFMPPISLYYDRKDEDSIISILVNTLPHEESEPDFIDQLIRKLRF